MRSSRLPPVKTLGDFDFTFQPSLKREQVDSLHALGFVSHPPGRRRCREHVRQAHAPPTDAFGDIGGFSALLTMLPRESVGFFVIHHLEGRNLRFDLRQLILDLYFPRLRPLEVLRPDSSAASRLRRFAGTYRASCHTCMKGERVSGTGRQGAQVEPITLEDASVRSRRVAAFRELFNHSTAASGRVSARPELRRTARR